MSAAAQGWTARQRWQYALKPASWPKLLVPVLLGQLLAVAATGVLVLPALLLGLVYMLALGSFIVLLNDWGDQHVDRLKRSMFPYGCSPKTIPDGILPARSVLVAGLAAGALGALLALLAAGWRGPGLFWLGLGCLALFIAYSLPPLRLNYRGGGELLEAMGVGMVLPWWQFVLQGGRWQAPELFWLAGFAALSLASAVASGLADEESDRLGGKCTLASQWGNGVARRVTEIAFMAGALLWLLGALQQGVAAIWLLPALLLLAVSGWQLQRRSAAAVTNAFAAQAAYKQTLHRGIWYGAMLLAAGVLLAAWVH